MQEPPYDRALALASHVKTMRNHHLAVLCSCGAERVIHIGRMADDKRLAHYTLAHVAMSLKCEGCEDGPEEVHMTMTVFGLDAPPGAVEIGWSIPLVVRPKMASYRVRWVDGVIGGQTIVDAMKNGRRKVYPD
jgi:hypothetical protein